MRQRFEIIPDYNTTGIPLTGKIVVVEQKSIDDPLPKTYNITFEINRGVISMVVADGTKSFPEYSENFAQHLRDILHTMYNTINHKPSTFIWNIKEN